MPSVRMSDSVLRSTAAVEQRLRVVTDQGAVTGYLVDLDDHDMLMFIQYIRENRPESVWSVALMPRSFVVLIEQERLDAESEEVRDSYRQMVGDRFAHHRPNYVSSNPEEQ